jgi:hypothetical protein
MVNDVMVPTSLKKAIFNAGKTNVIRKISNKKEFLASMLIGYSADGNAYDNKPSRYVAINNG